MIASDKYYKTRATHFRSDVEVRHSSTEALVNMANEAELSKRQLELQARLAKRRIDNIKQILESGVQAPANNKIDSDTTEVIARLYDTSLSEADISSCIGILQKSLEIGGLAPLLNLMKSEGYTILLRQEAAKAISVIGSNSIQQELAILGSSSSPEIRRLVKIAFGGRS